MLAGLFEEIEPRREVLITSPKASAVTGSAMVQSTSTGTPAVGVTRTSSISEPRTSVPPAWKSVRTSVNRNSARSPSKAGSPPVSTTP
jgi:hypothetical protein